MNILGIETSCDETAAAVVKDGRIMLSNVVLSQIDIHREFGGVVPEVAARSHIEAILPVAAKALSQAFAKGKEPSVKGEVKNLTTYHLLPSTHQLWNKVDAIAVTYGPGLPGALLVGTLTARTLALTKQKPLLAVDHVHAHVYANFLDTDNPPKFPILALIVSGGHSQLVLLRDHFDYEVLGQTADDAAGEAFDKVAKLLGLGYPGGPAIARAAKRGNPHAFSFTKPRMSSAFDFSFSGLKTAALRQAQQLAHKDYSFPSHQLASLLNEQQINDLAASFQQAAVSFMVDATVAAFEQYQPKSVIIAGGVAANTELRHQLTDRLPINITYAPPRLCTDNASMIASLGYFQSRADKFVGPLTLAHNPSLSMKKD